jgi:hypothetical protein
MGVPTNSVEDRGQRDRGSGGGVSKCKVMRGVFEATRTVCIHGCNVNYIILSAVQAACKSPETW